MGICFVSAWLSGCLVLLVAPYIALQHVNVRGEIEGVSKWVVAALVLLSMVAATSVNAQETEVKYVAVDPKGGPYEGVAVEQFQEMLTGPDSQYAGKPRMITVGNYYDDYAVRVYYFEEGQQDCFVVGSYDHKTLDMSQGGKIKMHRPQHVNKPHCAKIPTIHETITWKFKKGERYEAAKHDQYVSQGRLSTGTGWHEPVNDLQLGDFYVLHSTFSIPLGHRASGNLLFSQNTEYQPDKYNRLYAIDIPAHASAPAGTKGKRCYFVSPTGSFFQKVDGWWGPSVTMKDGRQVEAKNGELVFGGECKIDNLDYDNALATALVESQGKNVGYQGQLFHVEGVRIDANKEFKNPTFRGNEVLMYVQGGVKYLEVINARFEELKREKEGGPEVPPSEGSSEGQGSASESSEGGHYGGVGQFATDVLRKIPSGYGRPDYSQLDAAKRPIDMLKDACAKSREVLPRSVHYDNPLEALQLGEKNMFYLAFVPQKDQVIKSLCNGSEPLIKAYEFVTLPITLIKALENTAGGRTLGHVLRDYSFMMSGGDKTKGKLASELYSKFDIGLANSAGTLAIGFPMLIHGVIGTTRQVKKTVKGN